jgi:hypothetical protein
MEKLLKEERFGIISDKNKKFIIEFTKQMNLIGYFFGGKIGDGWAMGHYMIVYSKNGEKNKKVIARIYIRDKGVKICNGKEHYFEKSIVLRLFFTNIDKHINYIENAPSHIKLLFTNDQGLCTHHTNYCPNRKTYTINKKKKKKCGYTFLFTDPKIEHIKGFIDILKEFYIKEPAKNQQPRPEGTGYVGS